MKKRKRERAIAYMESTCSYRHSDLYQLIPLSMSSIESHLSNTAQISVYLKKSITEILVDCVIYTRFVIIVKNVFFSSLRCLLCHYTRL